METDLLSIFQLAVTLMIELAVSYYNDHINEWEQLLETLPQEGNRLWSLNLEYTAGDPKALFSEKEWKEISSLQTADNSLTISSQDNLEITVSKTALDVLTKLGQVILFCGFGFSLSTPIDMPIVKE